MFWDKTNSGRGDVAPEPPDADLRFADRGSPGGQEKQRKPAQTHGRCDVRLMIKRKK